MCVCVLMLIHASAVGHAGGKNKANLKKENAGVHCISRDRDVSLCLYRLISSDVTTDQVWL
jgi:hypothetical protein